MIAQDEVAPHKDSTDEIPESGLEGGKQSRR